MVYQDPRGDLSFRHGHVDEGSDQTLIKTALFFLISLILLSSVPNVESQVDEDSRSITFQPSEIPNIEFSYNQEEYQFELTWKSYYLNIKPFAIYSDQRYELKQIIPFLKNQYPNIDYRTAIKKFKNYHRWGFWLEKLPQNVADNLDYLGFDISDNNIPLDKVEIEELEYEVRTYKKIHIGNRFTFDFYDLIEHGFTFELNRTTILIGNVKGKTELDIDPITYSAPLITVIGFTEETPCTFWDLWNASNINGWNVIHNNNETNIQFQLDCRLLIGDWTTETWFADEGKQILINSSVATPAITTLTNSHFRLGSLDDAVNKIGTDGCTIKWAKTGAISLIHQGGNPDFNLYATTLIGVGSIQYVNLGTKSTNHVYDCLFINGPVLYSSTSDINNYESIDETYGLYNTQGILNNIRLFDKAIGILTQASTTLTITNILARNIITFVRLWAKTADTYIIDADVEDWTLSYGGGSTGEVYRQYTFNVFVVDKYGNPVENADLTLTYSGQGGETAYTGATPANGSIPEQTISKGFYNQTGGNTIYLYEPYKLTITATDYRTQTFIFNLSEPIIWTIPLARARVIESDAPWIAIAIILSIIALLLAWGYKR